MRKEFFLRVKMIPGLLKKTFKGGRRSILHFFLAFTGLFLILTGIILQVSRAGMYTSIDRDLEIQIHNTTDLVNSAVGSDSNTNSNGSTSNNRPPARSFGSFTVLYDKDGDVINDGFDEMATVIASSGIKMDHEFIGKIGSVQVASEPYRTTIMAFSGTLYPNNKKLAYVQIFQSVGQVQGTVDSTSQTIRITMFIFWLLSLFVSIYLSRVSQRPLEIALERQKAFVSNASHELRTPLAIMQNRLQLLFQHPNATIIDESENISASLNEVRNMRVLTSNLLNMAKSDGSVNIQLSETGEKFFQEIFENFEILAHEQGRVFDSSIQFDGTTQLDQGLIKQVLTILFDNAVKYTCENGTISVKISKQRTELLLIVSDDGLGISNMDKKKIFDRFYRVDESRTRGKGGLGLGLSLANEIVRAMKGRITVEDNRPQGTRFIVKLKI